MSDSNYPKFCPVAMAASLLEPRWTMLLLCEMWFGSTRFNEIQRGVPGMSPGLLSKRLKEMEANGLVMRCDTGRGTHAEYFPTPLANELEPLIRGLGEWAHRNIDCEVSLQNLDARLLMWKIRGKIDLLQLPKRKSVIQFILNDASNETANYWLVAKPGEETDLCYTDPKFDVDLYIVCELRALTSAWMGYSTFEAEIAIQKLKHTSRSLDDASRSEIGISIRKLRARCNALATYLRNNADSIPSYAKRYNADHPISSSRAAVALTTSRTPEWESVGECAGLHAALTASRSQEPLF